MFLALSLGIIRFSAPPLVSPAPGRESAPPDFFSAPAKINPAHATEGLTCVNFVLLMF